MKKKIKKNLILSLSNDENIKLWNIDNLEYILNFKGEIEKAWLLEFIVDSSCCI